MAQWIGTVRLEWNGCKGGTVVDDIKILAKVASCMFILCSFGHWFVNCKKVRSFVFPGTLDMRVRNGTVTAVELMVS